MIHTRKLRGFRDALVASGIPLLSVLQENREVAEWAVAGGELRAALPGRISGLQVNAHHQSGGAFCSTTNDSPAGLAGLVDIVASPVRRGETPQDSPAFADRQEKLGKDVAVRPGDLEQFARLADLAGARYALHLRTWDRYLEVIGVDGSLRNDRQRHFHCIARRDVPGESGEPETVIEESFVVRRARDLEPAFRRLEERVALREAWLSAPKHPLPAPPFPVVFAPYAAAQLALLLLAPSVVAGPGVTEPARAIGLRVGGENITLVDDPTRPHLAGSFRVDEEGNPAEVRRLIDRGTVLAPVCGAPDALRAGLVPGPCRAAGFDEPPRPAFSNLALEPHDDLDCAGMLARLGDALLVQSITRPFLADPFGSFRFQVETAWFVAGGERRAVAGAAVKGSLRELFTRVAFVGRDVETLSGFLPQPDGRRLPQSCGAPSLCFEELHAEPH